jgi:hypothetical protein
MNRSLTEIEAHAFSVLKARGNTAIAARAAADCAWLEGVNYPGLTLLSEALADAPASLVLEKDLMGLDLQNVSCVFLADDISRLHAEHGRLFLRNVRHGLYLVPLSVRGNFGIGCPVDPSFGFGGERTKNPYAEKLQLATANGVEVNDAIWSSLAA